MQAGVACTGAVHTCVAAIHSRVVHDGLDVASYAWLHIAESVDSPSSPNTIPKLPAYDTDDGLGGLRWEAEQASGVMSPLIHAECRHRLTTTHATNTLHAHAHHTVCRQRPLAT